MVLRMVRSFLAQAVRAPLVGLPAAWRRARKARLAGSKRLAMRAATQRPRRRSGRPPQVRRWLRWGPESWAKGARPASEAACRRSSCPSSGSRARSVAATTGPMPGTERERRLWAAKGLEAAIRASIRQGLDPAVQSREVGLEHADQAAGLAPEPGVAGLAQAVRMSRDRGHQVLSRRATRSASRARSGGAVGRSSRLRPISASTRASTRSVLASRPVARANSRARAGG